MFKAQKNYFLAEGITEQKLRTLNILLFGVLLGAFFGFPFHISGLAMLVLLFQDKRILSATNLVLTVFGISYLIRFRFSGDEVFSSWSFSAAILAMIAVVFLYLRWTVHWTRVWCGLVFLIVSVLSATLTILEIPLLNRVIYVWLTLVWGFAAWSRSIRKKEDVTWLRLGLAIQPFCTFNPVPVLEPEKEVLADDVEKRDLQWRTMKLIFLTMALKFTRDFWIQSSETDLFSKLFVFFNMSASSGLKLVPYANLSLLEWWGVGLGHFAFATLMTFLSVIPGVLYLRIFGWDLLCPVYNLFRSKSLYQFFENIHHYYNKILVDQFVFPMMHFLSWIRNGRLRLYAAFFCGIIFCGFFYHACRYPELFLNAKILTNLTSLLHVTTYWVILAGTAILSFIFERNHKRTLRPIPLIFRNVLYIAIAATFLVFVREYEQRELTVSDHWNYFLRFWIHQP